MPDNALQGRKQSGTKFLGGEEEGKGFTWKMYEELQTKLPSFTCAAALPGSMTGMKEPFQSYFFTPSPWLFELLSLHF